MFEVYQNKRNKKYYFRLMAKNGESILASQPYSNRSSVLKGVKCVIRNAYAERADLKESKNGKYYFLLKSPNGHVIGKSENYASKKSMETGLRSVIQTAKRGDISWHLAR